MLRASLKELVFNWQPLFSFIYRFLTGDHATGHLQPAGTDDLTEPGRGGSFGRAQPRSGQKEVLSTVARFVLRMTTAVYGICEFMGWPCRKEHSSFWIETAGRRRIPSTLPGVAYPASPTDADAASGKTPFSVISARLDDSRSIVDTLLPETYFQIMTRIWDESDRVLASYGGHRAKRSGTDVQYIIPRQADTDPAYDAICCAVELRDKMREIEASLKADGEWFADIRLNIGISSGRDHLQQEDLTASMAFMLPGGAADQAFHLSAIAHGGAIWITKSAFSHLTPQQMKRITFGIYRDDRLIRNIFAQVSELPHAPDTPSLGRGIRSLSVTRIIAVQSPKTP